MHKRCACGKIKYVRHSYRDNRTIPFTCSDCLSAKIKQKEERKARLKNFSFFRYKIIVRR